MQGRLRNAADTFALGNAVSTDAKIVHIKFYKINYTDISANVNDYLQTISYFFRKIVTINYTNLLDIT